MRTSITTDPHPDLHTIRGQSDQQHHKQKAAGVGSHEAQQLLQGVGSAPRLGIFFFSAALLLLEQRGHVPVPVQPGDGRDAITVQQLPHKNKEDHGVVNAFK